MNSTYKNICLLSALLFLLCPSGWAADTPHLDNYGRLIVNDEPFFPLGLYVVHCTNGRYDKELKEIANSPFNTLINYAVNKCGSSSSLEQIRTYLDKIESHNLKLIFSLKDYFNGGQTDLESIKTRVRNFRDHPAIISWYFNDELPPENISALEKGYDLIKALDPKRPVWSVHWNTDWLLQEAHTTDVVGVDPYPIGNHPITLLSRMADRANSANKPLWLVPQIFDWRDYPGDERAKTGRPPTYEEMRAMTYLALNHGAKGLVYYSYFNIRDDKDYEERWPQIKRIAAEVKQLKAAWLSTQKPGKTRVICNNKLIDLKLARNDGQFYLVAVNTQETEIGKVTFEFLHEENMDTIRTLFEDERSTARIHDGKAFYDGFSPYEVQIYNWICTRTDEKSLR